MEELIEKLILGCAAPRKNVIVVLKILHHEIELYQLMEENSVAKLESAKNIIEMVGNNSILIDHLKNHFYLNIKEMKSTISCFDSFGVTAMDFSSFMTVDPKTGFAGGVVNSNNVTFDFVTKIYESLKKKSDNILKNIPFEVVIKMASKIPLENFLSTMSEVNLLKFALDLITKSSMASEKQGIFNGFIVKSSAVGEFVPNYRTEYSMPVIFLDIILEYLKKNFQRYIYGNKEKKRIIMHSKMCPFYLLILHSYK